MKWKRRSSRIFCADGGGPNTPYSRGEMQALEFQQCPLPKMRDWTGVRSEGPGIAANRLFLCSQHSLMSDVFMTNFMVLSGKQYNKIQQSL